MFPKPPRGEFRRERKQRSHDRSLAEDREMAAAKRRDGNRCRRPHCPHCKKFDLALEAAHRKDKHRGMGGNPKLDRTERRFVIALCVFSHDDYDNGEIDIQPRDTEQFFDGPVDWYEKHPETGRMEHVYSEKQIGVSVAVGA